MKHILISIVVPIYNVQDYLDRCIESIIRQSYDKFELLLVDDGSTDSSGAGCDRWSLLDKRIRVIHKKNGGLSSARNAGIQAAIGSHIGFVDGDDFIHERMYEVLLEKLLTYETDISICNRYDYYDDGRICSSNTSGADLIMNSEEAILEMNSFRSFDMSACDKLYKKELFDEICFPKGCLSEDFYVMPRLFDKAEKICYTPQPLYYYLQRQGSITRNKKINFDFAKAAKEQMEYVEQTYPGLTSCVHAAYASANMTVYNFHLKNHVRCSKENTRVLKKAVKENLVHMMNNQHLPYIKKIQGFLFARSLPLYKLVFWLFNKMK